MYPVKWIGERLGPDLCNVLPAIHAFGGCDTTSRLFGKGKGLLLKMTSNVIVKNSLDVLCKNDSGREDVIQDGEKLLLRLYNAPLKMEKYMLNHLRYLRF